MAKRNVIFAILLMFLLNGSYLLANTSPFEILRSSKSARAAGLGGCFVAMPNDPGALFVNPATISTVDARNFSATFFKHVLDINSGQVSYLTPYEDYGNFAASVNFTSYGSFDYADKNGDLNGTFSGSDVTMGLSYSNELDSNLYWGATAKVIYMSLEDASSMAFAIDAGIIYQLPEKKTNIGLSILHVGTQITKFEDYSEDLPMDIRLGINHRLEGLPLLVNLSFHHLADDEDSFFDRFLSFSIGGELYLGKNLDVRLGYDNKLRRDTSPESDKKYAGFSAGVGIKLEQIDIDYAMTQVGTAALLHRIGLRLKI